ncbi:MAG: hypothetical protein P1R58_11430, partial [bacterium]|nr:hypothetical protein [bacterium]
VKFKGSYLNPSRTTTSFAYLVPEETSTIEASYYVPGNYGLAEIRVELFDVVDTMDIILPQQKFFEQPFVLSFRIPDEMHSYLDRKIGLPPRVENHPDFDNEFSRILLFMLNEGKSVETIIKEARADSAMAYGLLGKYVNYGYLKLNDGQYTLTFPVIGEEEAEETRQLALTIADSLVNLIERNLPAYWTSIDSLVQAGAMSDDSNSFYDGGTMLYRKHPAISAFLLWYTMGRNFITRSAPLLLYDNTDPCNAHLPYYMYAVQGGDVVNGSHFYAPFFGPTGYQIVFGDSIPDLDCTGWDKPQRRNNNWAPLLKYEGPSPEIFVVDTAIVKIAMAALGDGQNSILKHAYNELFAMADKHGHFKVLFGHRYWYWNLIATRTQEKLIEKGIVSRRGDGLFRFDGKQAKTGLGQK